MYMGDVWGQHAQVRRNESAIVRVIASMTDVGDGNAGALHRHFQCVDSSHHVTAK